MGITDEGDFCICDEDEKVWCAGTCCAGDGIKLRMQDDGHLLVDHPNKKDPLWRSKTQGNPKAKVVLSNKGVAEIKNRDGKVLWSKIPNDVIMMDSLQIPPTAHSIPAPPPAGIEKRTYIPGLLQVNENGLLLSRGLKSRQIAKTGRKVQYHNGKQSDRAFHIYPDAGATFPTSDGGFVYVSNSEDRRNNKGGVGAIRFDKKGNIIDYRMLLTGTTANCGGGTCFTCL